jgi:hypothetical protein
MPKPALVVAQVGRHKGGHYQITFRYESQKAIRNTT